MKYRLLILDSVKKDVPVYRVVERNFDSVTQAQNAKRPYIAAREGIVNDAIILAEDLGLRSPWKIDEDK